MPPQFPPSAPLVSLTQALRQCRLEARQTRQYAEVAILDKSTKTLPLQHNSTTSLPESNSSIKLHISLKAKRKLPFKLPPKPENFRPSQAIRQNRFDEHMRKIKCFPRIRSSIKQCPDPVKVIVDEQIKILDPTGEREKLFSATNPERVKPGDILLVRLKSGDPFSGVCLNIRQIHSKVDWAILLRNNLTRVGVEMWFKIFSPNVKGIEIVQRKVKRARRAKLYYMRDAKHDMGSVEGIVRQYNMAKAGHTIQKKAKKGKGKR